jgi:hypothetical protein
MSPVQSIKLAVVCGALLGAPIACLITFAQSPTPVPNSFATPTPNPGASPPPGVQASGVAVPVPVLDMAQYLQRGAHEDPDVILLLEDIQKNFDQALDQLAAANPDSSQVTQALGKALIYDKTLSVNKNLACATCHMAYSGFTGASSFFNGTTSAAPGSVPIAKAGGKGRTGESARENRRVTLMRLLRRSFITTRPSRISTAATFGTCARAESVWGTPPQSRHRGLRPIPADGELGHRNLCIQALAEQRSALFRGVLG